MKSTPLETVTCGICGSGDAEFLFQARDYIYGNAGSWPVARCRGCGVVYMNPRIPPSEIGPYYPRTYYTNAPSGGAGQPRWRRELQRATLSRYYGYPEETGHLLVTRLLRPLLCPFLRQTSTVQKFIHARRLGRVLDVGCGNGERLDRYRALGWETWGVEVGADSARYAAQSGHQVFVGLLADAKLPAAHFDAVTLWDTLEHIHNPLEDMTEVCRVLKPGGEVYVYVPNFGSGWGRRFRDRWYMFTAPLHYYHYTAETLSGLLARAGFDSIRIEYPLGSAGFTQTISAWLENRPGLRRLWDRPAVRRLTLSLERFMPRGHLLAVARKPGSPGAVSSPAR